jgi:AcrR family transcriptional regulator
MSHPPDSLAFAERLSSSHHERVIGARFGMAIEARFDGILGAARDVIARRGFHQASIREIAGASGLSLAGLYHYVGGKDELLFLVLDRSLDGLLAALETASRGARSAEARLHALVETHLAFASRDPQALKIINRDYELLAEPHRSEIAAKRQEYVHRALAVLRELDHDRRPAEELYSATNLLLGMLNGIATRPFVRPGGSVRALATEVASLFLHGFLGRDTEERSHDPQTVELGAASRHSGLPGDHRRV